MNITHTFLAELLLGRLPTEEELPNVLLALTGGARVTYIQARAGAPLRAVILLEQHSRAADAAAVLRPGRDAVEQLAVLGAEIARRGAGPGDRVTLFAEHVGRLAAAEERAQRALEAQENS